MDELGKFERDVDFVKEAIQKVSELKCPEHDVKLDIHVFNLGAGLIQLKCPKCVKPDTIIPGDYKPISEYNVGDRCIGLTGHTRVLKTYRRPYEGEMVVIKACGLLPIELTPEHPVLVVTQKVSYEWRGRCHRRITLIGPYWKRAEDVLPKKNVHHRGVTGDFLVVPRVRGEVADHEIDLTAFTKSPNFFTSDSIASSTI